ncbi:dehalogenase [Dehalococcoides mccartyi]|jgi:uncharacterized membrane protein|uniref:hypothetical protein n=1 Tax=Dehalococcoides mccartyi TaxID=61435 RepID=UPI0004E09610|nr:hypothetical protein [Dehalococcoides mccartyi]AII57479.1 dehalogenase [Dehalococcoides mccartyi CG1]APH11976.1 dehalogenase [Dehalococcoides mccartyi]
MWFIAGLMVGAILIALMWILKRNKTKITWYEWFLGAVGLVLLLFTVQNFFASLAEMEAQAAYMFLLTTGLPSVILLAVVWQLLARRAKRP